MTQNSQSIVGQRNDFLKKAITAKSLSELGSSGTTVTAVVRPAYLRENRQSECSLQASVVGKPVAKQIAQWLGEADLAPKSIHVICDWQWRRLISTRLAPNRKLSSKRSAIVVDSFLAKKIDAIEDEIAACCLLRNKALCVEVSVQHPAKLDICTASWRVRVCEHLPNYDLVMNRYLESIIATLTPVSE